jgi:hypothetical protein
MKEYKSLTTILAMAAMADMSTKRYKARQDGLLPYIDLCQAPRPKGLKSFIIDGVQVYAINEKNAIRKDRNKSANSKTTGNEQY